MASVNFSGGKLHGSGETLAQFRHSERDERLKHEHTNEDIDKTATRDNWSVQGLSYAEMQARYTARVAEVDKTASNHRKDRVTCVCAVVPVPDGMTDEQARQWYCDVWDTFERHYGAANMIDACVHVDEKHDYIDPDTKETRTSRTHAHFYFVPERDGNFDAKGIVSRAEMKSLNRELDTISRERYGLRFMDGTKAKSRGTVEQLKQRSENEQLERQATHNRADAKQAQQAKEQAEREQREAEQAKQAAQQAAQQAQDQLIGLQVQAMNAEISLQESQDKERRIRDSIAHAKEQKLDALRERDAARSGRDVVNGLQTLQNAVFGRQTPEVDILATHGAKRSLTGRETPATVTISREDFDTLREQAAINRATIDAARQITAAYNGMKDAAADINQNRLDSFDRTRDAVTAELSEEVSDLRAELSRTRGELEQERARSAQFKDKAALADKLQGKLDRRERFMDGYTLQNGRTLLEEYNHKHHRSRDIGFSR